jgi:D-tyrosyl-tRNA(Tyr) deacylase
MRLVIQRVRQAGVRVDDQVVSSIDRPGLLILVGATHDDTAAEAARLAAKAWDLRIMADEKSASDLGAPILVVSQFTLYADTRKGRRPSWKQAAPRAISEPLVNRFVAALADLGAEVHTGEFGAMMDVSLTNSGPVTIILDSRD